MLLPGVDPGAELCDGIGVLGARLQRILAREPLETAEESLKFGPREEGAQLALSRDQPEQLLLRSFAIDLLAPVPLEDPDLKRITRNVVLGAGRAEELERRRRRAAR